MRAATMSGLFLLSFGQGIFQSGEALHLMLSTVSTELPCSPWPLPALLERGTPWTMRGYWDAWSGWQKKGSLAPSLLCLMVV